MSKRVLFVRTRPLESNTSSSLRAVSYLHMLKSVGYDVTLLTADMPTDTDNFDLSFQKLSIPTIKLDAGNFYSFGISRIKKSILSKPKRMLRSVYSKVSIFDPLASCVKSIRRSLEQVKDNFSIMISCSDPKSSHLVANFIIQNDLLKIDRYIQIWGDPLASDVSKASWIPRYILKTYEENMIKVADKIVYVSPFTLESQKKMFPKQMNKMHILFPAYIKKSVYSQVKKISTIGYFGDYFSSVRNILEFYFAVIDLGLSLTICGNTNLKLQETERIKIYDRIAFEEVKKIESEVDLLVLISNKKGSQIPGKLYHYAGTNRPILIIEDGDIFLKNIFGKYENFWFTKNERESIKQAILEISSRHCFDLKPIDDFSIDEGVRHFNDIIQCN